MTSEGWDGQVDAEWTGEEPWNKDNPEWRNPPNEKMTVRVSHGEILWTACYDDDCMIHLEDKVGSKWFPKRPGSKGNKQSENTTHQQDSNDELVWVGPEASSSEEDHQTLSHPGILQS